MFRFVAIYVATKLLYFVLLLYVATKLLYFCCYIQKTTRNWKNGKVFSAKFGH